MENEEFQSIRHIIKAFPNSNETKNNDFDIIFLISATKSNEVCFRYFISKSQHLLADISKYYQNMNFLYGYIFYRDLLNPESEKNEIIDLNDNLIYIQERLEKMEAYGEDNQIEDWATAYNLVNNKINWRKGIKFLIHMTNLGAHGILTTEDDQNPEEDLDKILDELDICAKNDIKIFGYFNHEYSEQSFKDCKEYYENQGGIFVIKELSKLYGWKSDDEDSDKEKNIQFEDNEQNNEENDFAIKSAKKDYLSDGFLISKKDKLNPFILDTKKKSDTLFDLDKEPEYFRTQLYPRYELNESYNNQYMYNSNIESEKNKFNSSKINNELSNSNYINNDPFPFNSKKNNSLNKNFEFPKQNFTENKNSIFNYHLPNFNNKSSKSNFNKDFLPISANKNNKSINSKIKSTNSKINNFENIASSKESKISQKNVINESSNNLLSNYNKEDKINNHLLLPNNNFFKRNINMDNSSSLNSNISMKTQNENNSLLPNNSFNKSYMSIDD